jgi:DNA-binding XRE family transcriptional regulator
VPHHIENSLRTHRKRSGFTLRALAGVIGFTRPSQISRYERNQDLPPLLTALAYEIMFRVPVSDLFAGVREALAVEIEKNLGELEKQLKNANTNTAYAKSRARLAEWLAERRTEQLNDAR